MAVAASSATLSTVDRAALGAQFVETRATAGAVIAGATVGGVSLLDGSVSGGTEMVVVATAASGSATRAQTSALARSETLTFKSYGIFAGMASSERQVTLAAGDSQQDVVNKINSHAEVGARVRANIGEDGKLLIEARQLGTAVDFRFDSNRNAAADSTGVGRANITSAAGSDDQTRAGAVTALVAQTQTLKRNENINFKSYGVFKGLSTSERQVRLSAGDSQADVVRKINEHASVGQWVEASVDQGGRLVLTNKNGGTPYEFKVDASRDAGSNTTGIGRADMISSGATDGEFRAAFVTARKVQSNKLAESESLRFEDSGIFAGLRSSDRTVSLSKGSTQQDVISAINNHATVGEKVVASSDAAGRLVIHAREAGSHVQFTVDSNRGDRSDSTGVGTGNLVGDNGVTVATEERALPALELGSSELAFELSFDDATLEALGIDELDLSTVLGAEQAVAVLEDAVATLDAQVAATDANLEAIDRTTARLDANRASADERARAATDEQATGARARTLKDASSALLLYSSLRPSLALRLLQ